VVRRGHEWSVVVLRPTDADEVVRLRVHGDRVQGSAVGVLFIEGEVLGAHEGVDVGSPETMPSSLAEWTSA
jgi:hypothetical protein